jgi:hypothetical protein
MVSTMADKRPEIIFETQQIEENDWQIRAHCPGAELEYIKGFKSKAEAEKWPASSKCQDWRAKRGYGAALA